MAEAAIFLMLAGTALSVLGTVKSGQAKASQVQQQTSRAEHVAGPRLHTPTVINAVFNAVLNAVLDAVLNTLHRRALLDGDD